MTLGRRALACLRLRCPRCAEGHVFRGSFAMNPCCPECGLVYQRETGYFMGAMYFSYGIACVFIAAITVLLLLLLPAIPGERTVLVAWALSLPFVPLTFRLSRVIWMHLDHGVEGALIAQALTDTKAVALPVAEAPTLTRPASAP